MRFRTAVHLLMDNFSNVYKLLLYRLVSAIIFFSLSFVVLRLGLAVIVESAEVDGFFALIANFLRAVSSGDSAYLQGFQEEFTAAVGALLDLLAQHMGSIIGSLVGLVLLYLVARIVNGLALYTVSVVINDKMATYAKTRFSAAFVSSFGRAIQYIAAYVIIAFVYDVLTVLISWFLFFYVLSFLAGRSFLAIFASLMLTLTAILALEALKLTLFSSWIPAMVSDREGLGRALKISLTNGKNFGIRFSSYLIACYLIAAINVLFAICTIGSGLFLTVPMSFFFLLALQFTHYYEDTGKKYFISYMRVSKNENGIGQ